VTKKVFKVASDYTIKEKEEILDNNKEKDKNKENILLARYANAGFYIITPLLLGVFIGIYLDRLFNTKPIFVLTLIILGTVASFYNIFKLVK